MYRHHAFISYAWADDQSFDTEGGPGQDGANRGWVSTFQDRYRKHLGQAIGIPEGERIWIDYEQLRGNDLVTPKISDDLKDSALLIPILSKAWFVSRWCRQEFTTFIEHHSDWRERLFPVWMNPVEPDDLDGEAKAIWDQLRELLGYEFWYQDQDNRIRTYWFPVVGLPDRDYSNRQQKMARDMAKRLRQLGQLAGGKPSPEPITPAPSQPSAKGRHLVIVTGGSSDLSLVQEIARLAACEGLGYVVPLMAQDRRVEYKPSELLRDLREKLERATTVLMVFRVGPMDEVRGQLREYAQVAARHTKRALRLVVCQLGDRPLDFRLSGLDARVHPVTDGDMRRILEIVSRPPAREAIQGVIEGIIPSVSTQPDSTTALRQMRDERTRQLSE